MCLLNSFYPKDINVKWKVDGVIQDTGIQESVTEGSAYELSGKSRASGLLISGRTVVIEITKGW